MEGDRAGRADRLRLPRRRAANARLMQPDVGRPDWSRDVRLDVCLAPARRSCWGAGSRQHP
eukprot:315119-Prymnesium_polylepis.1